MLALFYPSHRGEYGFGQLEGYILLACDQRGKEGRPVSFHEKILGKNSDWVGCHVNPGAVVVRCLRHYD